MNKSNGICKICNGNRESYIHLLFSCDRVKGTWKRLENVINNILNLDYKLELNIENIVFIIVNEDIGKNETMFIKALIVQAKWLIWKERNNVKYGNKTIIDSAEMYKQIINQCNKYF